jgi:uncharacterized protein YkwD
MTRHQRIAAVLTAVPVAAALAAGLLLWGGSPSGSVAPGHPAPAAAPQLRLPLVAIPRLTSIPALFAPAAASPETLAPPTPTPASSASPRSPGPASAPPAPTSSSDASQAVFQAINQERAQEGLAALAWSGGLAESAHLHNLAMAGADELSHQVSGEASLGTRISDQGVAWSWCAENIGDYSELSTAGALAVESAMFDETPPNDEHRLNILTAQGTMVGVDVVFDPAHGWLWLTEDFAN